MTNTAQCTRCKPNKPCLSHSFLPFGQCWLELDSPLLKAYPERRIREASGDFKRDDSGRFFFNLKGLSFDETPLGYLDWLAGQEWLRPGVFRDRLFKYLRHPCIQRELEDLFPDPDDDSRKPAFTTQVKDRWHGQIRHKEEPPPELDEEDKPMNLFRAWHIIADYMTINVEAIELSEHLDLKQQLIGPAVKFIKTLTEDVRNQIRAKYRAVRAMIRRLNHLLTLKEEPTLPYIPGAANRKCRRFSNPPVVLEPKKPLRIKRPQPLQLRAWRRKQKLALAKK
jgi:hypothetical protein